MEHIRKMEREEAETYVRKALSQKSDFWERVEIGKRIEGEIRISGKERRPAECTLRQVISDELGVSSSRYKIAKGTLESAKKLEINIIGLDKRTKICEEHRTTYLDRCPVCHAIAMGNWRSRREQAPKTAVNNDQELNYRQMALEEVRTNTDSICEKISSLIDVWGDTIKGMSSKQRRVLYEALDKVVDHIETIKGELKNGNKA